MGGLFGLLAESRWPGLFSAMVLVDITPRWDTAGVERILAFMTAHPDGFASLTQAADVISAYMPHRPRKSEQSLRALLREDGHGRWRWHWDPRLVAELARDSEQHQDALAEAARQVKCPLLLVSGVLQRPGHAADRGRIPGAGAACAPCTAAASDPHGRRR